MLPSDVRKAATLVLRWCRVSAVIAFYDDIDDKDSIKSIKIYCKNLYEDIRQK